ncbi:hypothetical protein AB0P21_19810 [Kribbella sp. NPDC056861]|uniref:pPIWI_RE_Y domain-containing protein n=1 Tax=Kribbella sp. NPDC056861 TaxID=3154857 RepID=UPI0034470876
MRITMAQLASGIIEYAERLTSGSPFRLPYPANLQLALDRLTLLSWHQRVAPPPSVVDLLQLAHTPFEEWPLDLEDAELDPDESLLTSGRPSIACEELGRLRGDVEAELRETELMHAVLDKSRAHDAPESYVAFRRLLISRPSITSIEIDAMLAEPHLALLAGEVRRAYADAPPEAIADGIVRTCGGCLGLRLPLDDDRTWTCVDDSCPDPSAEGPDHRAAEGVLWLRRELRTFIAGPGRAELRIAQALTELGVETALWPDFDTYDLAAFSERPWVVDVKAWRNPIRLARRLRDRPFVPPAEAERAFIVIAREQIRAQRRYLDRLRKACPPLRSGQRLVAVSEDQFLDAVRRRTETER